MALSRLLARLRGDRVAARFGTTGRGAPTRPEAWPADAPSHDPSPRIALAEAFTPTRPQPGHARLVGRAAPLARILGAVAEEQAHVVLYGERGRGKTSLANLVAEVAGEAGLVVARTACSAETGFDAMLRSLARDLPRALMQALPVRDAAATEGCEAALPPGRLEPRDLLGLARGGLGRLLLIVDEFDRVTEEATRTRLADTIKLASDTGAALSFMVVGVSDSLEQLLGRHPSIQRSVAGVPLPLLGAAEVEEIVARGARRAGLDMPPEVRSGIAGLARGVPYMAQLLALRAGQAALDRRDRRVGLADLAQAVAQVLAEMDPRIGAQVEALCEGADGMAVRALLRAIATGEQNAFGQFRAVPLPEGGWRAAGAAAPAGAWARLLETGTVRPCGGPGLGLFAFADAAMPAHLLLRAVAERSQAEAPPPSVALPRREAAGG